MYRASNLSQCENLPEDLAVVVPPPGLIEAKDEALIKATGIDFRIDGSRAFYVASADYVQVPPPQAFYEPIDWGRTASTWSSVSPQPRSVGLLRPRGNTPSRS